MVTWFFSWKCHQVDVFGSQNYLFKEQMRAVWRNGKKSLEEDRFDFHCKAGCCLIQYLRDDLTSPDIGFITCTTTLMMPATQVCCIRGSAVNNRLLSF